MTKKIYCYVDETGQDTEGKLFIVVAIVVGKEREALIKSLEEVEVTTGKTGKRRAKWSRTKPMLKEKYLDSALNLKALKNKIYYRVFEDSRLYQDLTTIVIAKAINRYIEQAEIKKYKATILIDGLEKNQAGKVSKSLRELGVKIRKVRGLRDESSAIIRLADSLAGFIREADEDNNKFKILKKTLEKEKIISELS